MSIIFQKSCPWFQNQPTEIKGRIAALSPNSPFLGSVSTSFSLFLLSEQLFVYFSPTFFFWKRFSHRFRSGFWIPNFSGFRIPHQCGFRITVHWIPDSNIKNLLDSGFQILLHEAKDSLEYSVRKRKHSV